MKFYVQKASGERELFSVKKFRRSLKRAGASASETEQVLQEVMKQKPKSTREIHKLAIKMLKKQNLPTADRYNLKQGIMELGPEGYPFEKFIGELFRAQGYKVETGVIIPGACVDHEIDCLIKKDGKSHIVETKFHNRMGIKSDVQTTLYVQARFQDLCDWARRKNSNYDEVWLVTNTKFTSQAMQYGMCKKMKLLGWNYPDANNLAQLVEKYNLFPITALTTLSNRQKNEFMQKGFVLCKDAEKHIGVLKKMRLSDAAINRIIEESQAICKI
jgi:hypothetical protein